MNRRTVILCLSTIAGMALAIILAVYFLFSGASDDVVDEKSVIVGQRRFALLEAVPSDAVLVSCFNRADRAVSGLMSGFNELTELIGALEDEELTQVLRNPLTISLHYFGKLQPLYIFDLSGVSKGSQNTLLSVLMAGGLYQESTEKYLLASPSQILVKSGARHYEKKTSILDAPGFVKSAKCVEGADVLFVSCAQSGGLMKSLFSDEICKKTVFFASVADWLAVDISTDRQSSISLDGNLISGGQQREFLTTFKNSQPEVSEIGGILPSYTLFAASLPLHNVETYIAAYKKFIDSKQQLPNYNSSQKKLMAKTGVKPEDFFTKLDVKEVATASFVVGDKVERVNLFRVGNEDKDLIFNGDQVSYLHDIMPRVYKFAYSAYASSVFGDLFRLKDESSFTYMGGWVISGSERAVDEFVSKGASKYTLDSYLAHAGKEGLLSKTPSLFVGYYSFTGFDFSDFMQPALYDAISHVNEDYQYCPAVLRIGKNQGSITISFGLYTLSLSRTRAPEYDRDTSVEVPEGPFTVMNSRTGKQNTFYQNSNLSICLMDENGKGLWGVPFGEKICGTVHTIDYFKNDKLQILFGAGTKIYLFDILGRHVNGFPLDLESEIVLGPDVYDFNGNKQYNIIVLHKNNIIQMYNLNGKKHEQWQGITIDETIKSLPEKLTVGDKDYWIVRTSIQTLIFPFYGGEPITKYSGNRRIRPDTSIELNENTVVVNCYDGIKRKINLE